MGEQSAGEQSVGEQSVGEQSVGKISAKAVGNALKWVRGGGWGGSLMARPGALARALPEQLVPSIQSH